MIIDPYPELLQDDFMKNLIFIIFFIFLGCSKSNATHLITDNPPVNQYDISEKFPDSEWNGLGTSIVGNEDPVDVKATLVIKNNVFVTEKEISGFQSNAIDIFNFISKTNVEWLDPNLNKIGNCYCSAETCRCEAQTAGLKLERTMIFSQTELTIEDVGEANGLTFKNFLLFRRNR